MVAHSIAFDVVGWGPQHSVGSANVVHYNFGWRLARSLGALFLVWAIAIPLMFIPYAIVVVLPAALGLSAFFIYQHLRSPEVATRCFGSCPDCGVKQTFDVPERFELPLEIQCSNCHRELWLRERVDAVAPQT